MNDTELLRLIWGMKPGDCFQCDKCSQRQPSVRWVPAIQKAVCKTCWPKKNPKRHTPNPTFPRPQA